MDFNKALFGFIRVAFSIMITLLVLFAGIKICSICYDFGYRVFTEPAMTNGDGQDVLVQVEKGISAEELGQLLEDKGLVRDHNLFYLQLKLSAYSGHIKPGIYTLNTSMTAKDMMVIMSSDKAMKNRHRLRSLRIHSNYPLSAFVSIIRLGNTRMIVDERLVTYINSLDRGNTPVLDEIEKEALRDFVPIIRKEMQSFLKLLLAMQKPMRILEVGTAVGFSAVLMAEYAPKGCQIVTIENYEKRIPIAKANFERAGKKEQITLLEGDATEILPQLEGQFDMIFMDAAKGQYINFMPQVLRLLKTGGVLVSDNVLQDGDIIESHYIVERRNRTIYKRMREYLYELTHSDELVTAVMPIGDGITVSTKL